MTDFPKNPTDLSPAGPVSSDVSSAASPGRDRLRKALTKDAQAIVIAADLSELVQGSLARLKAYPPAMIHLGQGFLAASLVQALPDRGETERTELQWRSSGPFGSLFIESRPPGLLRGTIFNPHAEVFDLKASLGPGLLQVRRIKKTSSTGIIQAQGDVAIDVLDYLERSEQKNCAMNLWVDIVNSPKPGDDPAFIVRRALGYLVHVLPQASEARMNQILFQWDRHLESLGPLSKWVLGADPTADILAFVTAELSPKIIVDQEMMFFCTCTEERAERALTLMSKAEAADLVPSARAAEDSSEAPNEVRCEFCGRLYLL